MKNSTNDEDVRMSNGATSVFITIFGLSGSRLATTEAEKRLVVWVLEKDQTFCGIGTVGFDICEMPWNPSDFDHEQAFVFSIVDGMKQKLGWETLDYEPNTEIMFSRFDLFRNLVSMMTVADINQEEIEKWWAAAEADDPILNGYPVCEKHGVLLSLFGCHACND